VTDEYSQAGVWKQDCKTVAFAYLEKVYETLLPATPFQWLK